VKRAAAIGLLVAAIATPADSGAVPVIVSNCRRELVLADPTTWQPGQWQALSTSFARTEQSRYWGGNCSVLAGDFGDFAEFASWWTGLLGRRRVPQRAARRNDAARDPIRELGLRANRSLARADVATSRS
jgi:hypothetical protein